MARRVTYILLGLTVLAGLTLRTWNLNFDKGIGSHPDERSTACFYAPSLALPKSWDEFKDPHRSPLNPLWDRQRQERRGFTYGHFPLYLGVLAGETLHKLAPLAETARFPEQIVERMRAANQACGGIAVAGRLVIALLDTWTILLLFFLGRRIYGPGAGLLAAIFYAFTAQAIQLSHFFAMDPASTTFTVLAVLGAVKMVQERTWRAVALTGVAAGLAVASKFSALPILAAPFVAAGVILWQERRRLDAGHAGDARKQLWAMLAAPAVLVIAFAAFFVASPYAVLDWKSFIQATLVEQGQMVRGIADFPFTRQYRNTLPYVYFIEQQVRWGLGWPLGIVALAGATYALGKLVLGRARPEELVVWSWLIPYFGLTGAFLAKFNRYMSPVLPFVLLFAAGLIWELVRRPQTSSLPSTQDSSPLVPPAADLSSVASESKAARSSNLWWRRALANGLAIIGIAGGLFWSAAYVHGVYGQEHTWITASRWIYEHVPPGSTILWELWDDPLPKAIPGEPGMDMGSAGLRNIDWSPYEEDTAEKYEILKQKLREADYVVYSSKRIYDSVDELPERYPMTIRYYKLMFDGQLGFELVQDVTAAPSLFGLEFPDQGADESWSLYDHPRVTIFRKVRDLSDAEFDALLGGTWEGAQHWYRGKDSPLNPLLGVLGMGSNPDTQGGLVNWALGLLTGKEQPQPQPQPEQRKSLELERPVDELPIVDNYRWNIPASENTWLGVFWWWLVVTLLGLLAWPGCFVVFRNLRDRGYFFSRTVGWLASGWILWMLASLGWAHNTVINAWLSVALIAVFGVVAAIWYGPEIWEFVRRRWPLLLVGEGVFGAAYVLWVLIRMGNPDLWQPWFGGEKFMEFAFLNGILRSPTFPPVDPHFAGGFINYYYFGLYLVAFLIKLTGIYAEVAFNLAVPTLFALAAVNAFGVAYSAVRGLPRKRENALAAALTADGARAAAACGETWTPAVQPSAQTVAERLDVEVQGEILDIELPRDLGESEPPEAIELPTGPADGPTDHGSSGSQPAPWRQSQSGNGRSPSVPWQDGLKAALLAPLFAVLIGNLDGLAQVARNLAKLSDSSFRSAIPLLQTTVRALDGLWMVVVAKQPMPPYDFWGPSRVIPNTINEFPFWSFLFADLHPHLLGIPFAVLFLGLTLAVIRGYRTDWRRNWLRAGLLVLTFALLLGALASVNLWDLPTYFGLGVLAVAVSQVRGRGKLDWPVLLGFTVVFLAGAVLLFLPFFQHYANVGASGVGLVRVSDSLGQWLLIWGFFLFILATWLFVEASRKARPGDARPNGVERWLSLALRSYDRLPRMLHLQRLLVMQPSLGFLVGVLALPLALLVAIVALLLDRTVLAICLPLLALAILLMWRRGRTADPGGLFVAALTATGLALLTGTQLFYLKDFLQGGDWNRMNTLFKFFIQVWVLLSIAAAIAVPRLLSHWSPEPARLPERYPLSASPQSRQSGFIVRRLWIAVFVVLLAASFAYPVLGTPARLDQRFPGWRPAFGTLNALDFMRQGAYQWPDGSNTIQLRYDWEAIQWLLDHVRGNLVIAESAQLDYYRAGGTRVASLTGLSGLSGMHESEQRYGDVVGQRNGLVNEFWNTADIGRTRQLMDELNIALVYVGQLERHQHPTVGKFDEMVKQGLLTVLYQNDQVTIYAVPGKLVQGPDGIYYPARALIASGH